MLRRIFSRLGATAALTSCPPRKDFGLRSIVDAANFWRKQSRVWHRGGSEKSEAAVGMRHAAFRLLSSGSKVARCKLGNGVGSPGH